MSSSVGTPTPSSVARLSYPGNTHAYFKYVGVHTRCVLVNGRFVVRPTTS